MSRAIIAVLFISMLCLTSCSSVIPTKNRPDEMTFAPLEFVVPEVEPIILKNGIHLYLIEDRELPMIQVTGMIGAGSLYELKERDGQGILFASLLQDGGAGGRSPIIFEEVLEDLAIDFSVNIDPYATTLSMSMLREDINIGLSIFDDVLRRPQFDADRLELLRRQTIEGLRRQDDSSQNIASRAFDAAVYGDHPFGRTATAESVNRVDRQHLLAFHDQHFVPENLWLAISGDFDKQEMAQRIRLLFADWEQGNYAPAAIPELSEPAAPAIWLADKDIPQTTVMIGGIGVSKDNPDVMPIRVMNAILGGGGFNSRLMREIRSNRGLAYSVYSYFMVGRRLPGTFIASGESKNSSAILMVSLMLDEIEKMRTEMVTEEELTLAKESRVNSFVFAFTDRHDVLTQQMRLDFYGYPAGYLQTYREKVMTVTREEVLRVAQTYLQPEQMAIVLVGRPEGYEVLSEKLHRPIQIVPRTEMSGDSQ